MADENKMEEFVSYVENLTVLELSKLVKTLEERLGVSAAAPVAVAAAPAAGAAAPAAAANAVRNDIRTGNDKQMATNDFNISLLYQKLRGFPMRGSASSSQLRNQVRPRPSRSRPLC